jgi:membrane-associated protease RseP (regulator of RpoE activity)
VVDTGLLVAAILVVAYVALLVYLRRSGRIQQGFDILGGFLLLWRTQRGKAALDKAGQATTFWEGFGDAAIVLVLLGGVLMLFLLVVQIVLFFQSPIQSAQSTPGPQYLLGVPVLNPVIPLAFGVIALAVALVVHEGAHGILARAQSIRVKSMGLLFIVVPVGAFVEPDEEDLEKAPPRRKLRIFAAGPAMNVAVAIVAALIFSTVLVGATSVDAPSGVMVHSLAVGSPAATAGFQPLDDIVYATGPNGASVRIQNTSALTVFLNDTAPNSTVSFRVVRPGGVEVTVPVVLTDRYAYYAAHGIAPNAASNHGKSFLGISFFDVDYIDQTHDALARPLSSFGAFAIYLYYPFFSFFLFDPLSAPYTSWMSVHGALAWVPAGIFFPLAQAIYWIFWLNLMIGTFNMLPAGFLDGGQMFNAALRSWLLRRNGVRRDEIVVEKSPEGQGLIVRGSDAATQAKLDRVQTTVRRTTWAMGLAILGMILIPIVLGSVIRAFGS